MIHRKSKNIRLLKRKLGFFTFKKLFYIILLLVIFGFIIFIFASGFFEVKFIICQKDEFLCEAEEQELFSTAIGKNIFFVNSRELADSAKLNNIELSSVQIKRKIPNKIFVNLESRKAFVLLAVGLNNYLADKDYFVFAKSDANAYNLPIIDLQANGLPVVGTYASEKTKKAIQLAEVLKTFFIPFNKISIDKKDSLTMYGGGFQAIFSDKKDFNAQVISLQLILRSSKIQQSNQSKLKKIDLRFDKPILD